MDRTERALEWLLEADPALRWQALQDVVHAPAQQVAAERARVATEGWGAQLLALQAADGSWGGMAWSRGFTSTMHVLTLLRELGLEPESAAARAALERVSASVTWKGAGPPECNDNRFFVGEVEPCINGQVGAAGAYFGQDVTGLIERLLSEQLADGGWNCDTERGSTRSSFNTTICVLEALLEQELRSGSHPELTKARLAGQEYLLERRMFRRRSTGEVIPYDRKLGPESGTEQPAWTRLAFPSWWHYDVLRGLDYLRRAGAAPDERAAEAVELLKIRQAADGRWHNDVQYQGVMPVPLGEGEGQPSRWNTLRALRVLDWYSQRR
jgi:hypothetical protein